MLETCSQRFHLSLAKATHHGSNRVSGQTEFTSPALYQQFRSLHSMCTYIIQLCSHDSMLPEFRLDLILITLGLSDTDWKQTVKLTQLE